jgi:hypothetical protein
MNEVNNRKILFWLLAGIWLVFELLLNQSSIFGAIGKTSAVIFIPLVITWLMTGRQFFFPPSNSIIFVSAFIINAFFMWYGGKSKNEVEKQYQTIIPNWEVFKNEKIAIEFQFPKDWQVGDPTMSNVYWVAVPNYSSEGNIILQVNPWATKVKLRGYDKEIWKSELLSSSEIYETIEFIEFDSNRKIDNVDALFCYYKIKTNFNDKEYYEFVAQWWHNNLLYTLKGQFSEPQLLPKDINQFKEVLGTISLIQR